MKEALPRIWNNPTSLLKAGWIVLQVKNTKLKKAFL